MPNERLPKKILYGEVQVGKRSHGGQKKRYKDTLKASLTDFNIPTESWEQIAQDRAKWWVLIRRDAGEYEAKRFSEAEQKRVQRKARHKASPTELSFFPENTLFSPSIWCVVGRGGPSHWHTIHFVQYNIIIQQLYIMQHLHAKSHCCLLGTIRQPVFSSEANTTEYFQLIPYSSEQTYQYFQAWNWRTDKKSKF